MVAEALGRRNAAAMSDLEVKYREKIKTAITDKVDAAKRRDAAWAKRINKGRKEYARGNVSIAATSCRTIASTKYPTVHTSHRPLPLALAIGILKSTQTFTSRLSLHQ